MCVPAATDASARAPDSVVMRLRRAGLIVLPIVALVTFTATTHIAGGRTHAPVSAHPAPGSDPHRFPSAAEFGRVFVGTANRFAAEHGEARRIGHPDCVQASPGSYMCSFVSTRPGRPRECRLMQGRWTPERASTITVTLAGRTGRCGTLRQALDSLR